jgi:hypothetical protein
MSSQVAGARTHPRIGIALVTLVLAGSVIVLATQATSIWSSRGAAQLRPAAVRVATSSSTRAVNGSQIPAGCWVKFGCDRGETIMRTRLGSGGRIPDGCRVKLGCQPDAGSRERH